MRYFILSYLIWAVAVFPICATAGNKTKLTGTFSNLFYNQESGDLGGVEVKIVYTRNGYQAAIQFSEGTPSKLVVAEIKFKGHEVYFKVPETIYEGHFEGQISNDSLKGIFKFTGGGDWEVDLPRKASYWD
jgi:hypothetical protein